MSEYITAWLNDIDMAHVREEIVRCKDCKYGRNPQQGLPWMCIRNCCAHFPIDPDGFCKWGERRGA